jgi:hypothetical protein
MKLIARIFLVVAITTFVPQIAATSAHADCGHKIVC